MSHCLKRFCKTHVFSINLNIFKFNLKFQQNRKLSYNKMSTDTLKNVNRTFNFNSYDIIGFDLDGTLLRYNLDEIVPMEYKSLNKFLTEKFNYSKELLKPMTDFDFDFMQKGLILDAQHGNVLKINSNGLILRASHGTKELSEDDVIDIYGAEKCWNVAIEYTQDPLSVWNGPISAKIRASLDYFDIPAPLIFAVIVDQLDASQPNKNGYNVWADVLESLIHNYSRENFSNGCSSYFEAIKSEPERYILKASPQLINWLKEVKKTKATYLLTGSNLDYANLTASYAFGSNWCELFDEVVTFAKKPGFFTQDRPFYQIENFIETEKIDNNELELNKCYSQGNWNGLKSILSKKLNKNPENLKSLYVGDNLIQDIYAPVKYSNVDTVAIVEELSETEIYGNESNVINYQKVISSKKWGSYFNCNDTPTFWNEILQKYASLCVPTMDYICKNPIDHEYQSHNFINWIKNH